MRVRQAAARVESIHAGMSVEELAVLLFPPKGRTRAGSGAAFAAYGLSEAVFDRRRRPGRNARGGAAQGQDRGSGSMDSVAQGRRDTGGASEAGRRGEAHREPAVGKPTTEPCIPTGKPPAPEVDEEIGK